MRPELKYNYDAATGIFYKYYYGTITLRDIITSWEESIKNKTIPKETKGFLLDYRNANLEMDIEENLKIAEFYKNHLDIFGNLRIAVVTVNPRDVVIPILVKAHDEGYLSRPFSTVEAALTWVLENKSIK